MAAIELSPGLIDLILANVADGVFTIDPEFKITFFNRSAEKITGYRSAETLGKPCHEILGNWTFDLKPRPASSPAPDAGKRRPVVVDRAAIRDFELVYAERPDRPPLRIGVGRLEARLDAATDMVGLDARGTSTTPRGTSPAGSARSTGSPSSAT